MSIIDVGGHKFYRSNVAFHFTRDNVYSPWQVIGVYMTNPSYQRCRYSYRFKHIEDEFKEELAQVDSEYIRGGPEFFESWRRRYQQPINVIGPIINYHSIYTGEFAPAHKDLFVKYVGACSPLAFVKLTIMHKLRDGYFSTMFVFNRSARKAKIALKEAGLI